MRGIRKHIACTSSSPPPPSPAWQARRSLPSPAPRRRGADGQGHREIGLRRQQGSRPLFVGHDLPGQHVQIDRVATVKTGTAKGTWYHGTATITGEHANELEGRDQAVQDHRLGQGDGLRLNSHRPIRRHQHGPAMHHSVRSPAQRLRDHGSPAVRSARRHGHEAVADEALERPFEAPRIDVGGLLPRGQRRDHAAADPVVGVLNRSRRTARGAAPRSCRAAAALQRALVAAGRRAVQTVAPRSISA